MIQPVRNPRTGINDYHFRLPSTSDVEALSTTLRIHQPAWAALPVADRVAALRVWRERLLERKPSLLAAICQDTGRQWESELEADLAISSIERWCRYAMEKLQPASQKASSIPFLTLEQQLVPYPLVTVISPWNFPLLLALIDAIPALLAGCAVMVKPSEVTPRFTEVMQLAIEAVPTLAGVFSFLQGDGQTGADCVRQADLVCFTGSTATGRKIYASAAERMIPVFLEMGGKDPAIVLPGADPEKAAAAILWGATANAGQSCLSIERVYVHESLFDPFTQLLAEKASRLSLAYPDMSDGPIGPIIFERQASIIDQHLADAVQRGARILTGSKACENLNGGWYCRPTVLVNVDHTMRIMTEETFGPIMPVMPFRSDAEAISLANDSIYGLSAAVFGASTDQAKAFATYLQAGAVSIQDAALSAVMHEGEKNAFRLSGIGGTRMGPSAIQRFMRQRVLISKMDTTPSPWWKV
ncbi:MAG: aldehyde dehydrogenase family protein [Bacteroidetes bacterium]|nr:aldehyde dehydrogenase family protein [Bacteroidota bacterium]